LLHTLFTNVEKRGHTVHFHQDADESPWRRGTAKLAIVIDEAPIEVSLREHLSRKDHVPTADEARWAFLGRQYDLSPFGDLILELRISWGVNSRTRWRDSKKGRLESLLGEVMWATDEAARGLGVHRANVAEQARLAEIARNEAEERERERRKKEAEEKARLAELEARVAHKRALERDARTMARCWSSAQQLRAFLKAVEEAVPLSDRGDGVRRWLEWASDYAERIDPLNEPHKIAKELEPDLGRVPSAEAF
jgi:hypothetical protein